MLDVQELHRVLFRYDQAVEFNRKSMRRIG
jgi:hypothetical protein